MSLSATIRTEDDVRLLISHFLHEENLNFHPDTPFADYINYENGEPTYTAEEAEQRDALVEQCFEVAGDRVYDIGMEVMKPVLLSGEHVCKI